MSPNKAKRRRETKAAKDVQDNIASSSLSQTTVLQQHEGQQTTHSHQKIQVKNHLRSKRGTVVIVDVHDGNDSRRIPRHEHNDLSQSQSHNSMSNRSIGSVTSSGTYASAQEFTNIDSSSSKNNFHVNESNYFELDEIYECNDIIDTEVNLKKSSECSGTSASSSSQLRPNHLMTGNDVTTPVILMENELTKSKSSTPCEENNNNSNDNDNMNGMIMENELTGWKLLRYTISNPPNDTLKDTLWNVSIYSNIQKLRLLLGTFICNSTVQTIIVLLIIVNALLMGIATFDFVTNHEHVLHIFATMDVTFLILFTIELGMQLFYHGLSLFQDGWLIFDFIIIVLSWSLQSIQIIRAFRIFRALRLVARLKVLRELISALGAVMPRMYAISMLLILIFYIFAVLFTQLFGDLELSQNYFTTLDASLFTCMDMMTLNWIEVTREVMTHRSWAWAPFVSYISITGFIVYNLIVAVVCDAVAVLDRTKQQIADTLQKELDDQAAAESQNDQIKIGQHRMNELLQQIQLMKSQHVNMCHTVDMLASELQQAMIVITTLQTKIDMHEK
jgi:hypothetical protein